MVRKKPNGPNGGKPGATRSIVSIQYPATQAKAIDLRSNRSRSAVAMRE